MSCNNTNSTCTNCNHNYSSCNNKCAKCGCKDSFLTSPPPCPTPNGCPDPVPCQEVLSSDCVIYTGDPIMCDDIVIIPSDSTMTEALIALADFMCGCCGGLPPTPVSYNCLTGVCFDPGDGSGIYSTLTACQTVCTSPPQPSWNCLNGNCTDPGNGSGTYLSLSTCQAACIPIPITYNCVNGNCVNPGDGTGMYGTLAQCQQFCEDIYISYDCVSGNCVDPGDGSGVYPTLIDCQDVCSALPQISYNCLNGNCTNPGNGSGTYSTLAECQAVCTSPPQVSYNCLNGNCTDPGNGSGTYSTLLACQAVCTTPPQISWKCLNGNCFDPNDGSGIYPTLTACLNVCTLTPNISYNCINGNCIDPGDGSGVYLTLLSCQAICSTPPPNISYNCFLGQCTDPGNGSGVYPTLLACQTACVRGPGVSYNCVSGNCVDPGTGLGLYPTLNACEVVCNPFTPTAPCSTECDLIIPAPLPGTTLIYSGYTITSNSSYTNTSGVFAATILGFNICNSIVPNIANGFWPVWAGPIASVPFTYTLNFNAPINNVFIYLWGYSAIPLGDVEEFIFTTDAGFVDITCTDYCCATITNGNTVTAMSAPGLNCPVYATGCPGGGNWCNGTGKFIISSSLPYTSITITGTGGGAGSAFGLCEDQFGTSNTSTIYTTFDALPIPAVSYNCVNCNCVSVAGPSGSYQTLLACQASGCENNKFITTWETTTAGESITLPYYLGGTYAGTIDWGDSTTSANSFATSTHIYASPGTYTVTVCGTTIGWNFNATNTSALKIKSVVTWGQLILGANVGYYFYNCSTLDLSSVSDTLDLFGTGITNFEGFFYNCASLTTVNNINFWDTSAITSMESMFEVCSLFNQSLNFNTTAVTNMSLMFNNCFIFNSTVTFDTSLVTDMYAMFSNCFAFNSPVIFTNTALVQFMNGMFSSCVLFNQPLNFNTVSVTNMTAMFSFATAFNNGNQPLLFNTISVNFMTSMFSNATAFQQNIGTWNVANVTNIVNFMLGKTPATWPQTYFNNLLCGWSTQVVTPGLMIHFGSAVYTTAIAQPCYDILDIFPNNWIINSGGGV